MKNRMSESGFTLLEVLVVVAIMGLLMISMFPSIMNSLETRDIENSVRDIQTTLQQARFRAVDNKVSHRVLFAQVDGRWRVILERESAAGVWEAVPGYLTRIISPRYVVTINLPASSAVEFSSVGIVEGYDSTRNSVTLQSLKLKGKRQPDLRLLRIYGGGSIQYERASST